MGTVIARNGEFELVVDSVGEDRGQVINTTTGQLWKDVYVTSMLAGMGWELMYDETLKALPLVVLSPNDLNADWIRTLRNPQTGQTVREEELALHDALARGMVASRKHLPGKHDQKSHAPKGGMVGWQVWQPAEGTPLHGKYTQLGNHNISYASTQSVYTTVAGTRKPKFTKQDVLKVLEDIPESHLNLIHENGRGLVLSMQDAAGWVALEDYGKAAGRYKKEDDFLSVGTKGRTKQDIAHTLRHELGHRAYHLSKLEQDDDWNAIADKYAVGSSPHQNFWYPREAARQKGPERGRSEYFAEAYAMYVDNRQALKQAAPEMYAYMEEVFRG